MIVRFLLHLDRLLFANTTYAFALMYHRIGTSGKFSVSMEELSAQIGDLQSRGFSFVHAENLASWSQEKGKVCAITFDDGYRDNQELASLDVPVTIFITTDPLEEEVGCAGEEPDPQGLVSMLKKSPHVRFGAHGVTHRRWTRISAEQLRTELRESKDTLGTWSGQPVRTCAYPKGSTNSDVELLVSGQFDSAFLADGGPIFDSPKDPFCIPRIGIFGGTSMTMFRLRTSVIFSYLLFLYFFWKRFRRL